MPRISLIASVAWIVPMMPGSTPSTPPSAQLGHQPGRRRLGIQAAVARAAGRREHRRLAFEAEDAAVDVRLPQQHAGVVDEVARGEVVGAVEDDVVVAEDVERVRRRERASRSVSTLTSGLRAVRRSRADCSFGRPTSACRAGSGAGGCSRRRRRSRRCRACRRRPPRGRAPPAIRGRPRRRRARAPALSFRCPSTPTSGRIRCRL